MSGHAFCVSFENKKGSQLVIPCVWSCNVFISSHLPTAVAIEGELTSVASKTARYRCTIQLIYLQGASGISEFHLS